MARRRLGNGERRPKYDLRVAAYGTVDETNAAIGVVRLYLGDLPEIDAMLGLIQNDLFDLGADLAVPQREGKAERLRVLASQVARLERDIDALNERLAPLDLVRAAGRHAGRGLPCIWRAPFAAGRNGSWWNSPRSRTSRSAARPRSALYEPAVGFPVRRQPLPPMATGPAMCFGCQGKTVNLARAWGHFLPLAR